MKILLIDHHALFRAGLSQILRQMPEGIDEIFEAEDFSDGLRLAGQHPDIDIALLELNSPGSEGAVSARFFRQHYPHIPLMVVSSEENCHAIVNALSYGASGYVCKSSDGKTLLSALGLVLSGSIYVPPQVLQKPGLPVRSRKGGMGNCRPNADEYGLTMRQIEILGYLVDGLSNKEIAEKTGLTEGTVKAHVAAVYQALRVRNRMEAVQVARQAGLADACQA